MMATKDQERKALEQIKKIVNGLGECSYIGTAFDGCFEIAEENIENDFACSMKERATRAEEEARLHKAQINGYIEALKIANENTREAERRLEEAHENHERKVADMSKSLAEANEDAQALAAQRDDLRIKVSGMEKKMADAEMEIMRLKAKLFDILFKD